MYSERLHDFQDLAAFQSRPVSLDMQTAPDLRLFAKRQTLQNNKWNKSRQSVEINQLCMNGTACKDRQVKHRQASKPINTEISLLYLLYIHSSF